MLEPRVVLKAVGREVLAISRVLEATVGHLSDKGDVAVDPHCPKIKLFRAPHRTTVVLGPHARGQPVLDVVGKSERFFFRCEALHRNDGPKRFLLNRSILLA